MNLIFKSNFFKDDILTGGVVVYASTHMYITMLCLYVARESEIQTPRESQLNEIIHRVNISFRNRLASYKNDCIWHIWHEILVKKEKKNLHLLL